MLNVNALMAAPVTETAGPVRIITKKTDPAQIAEKPGIRTKFPTEIPVKKGLQENK